MAAEGKPIEILSALISVGIDPEKAARVEREVSKMNTAIQRNLDRLNATKANKTMETWAASVKEMGGVAALTADQTKILGNVVEDLARKGAKVPLSLQPAITALEKFRSAEKAAADEGARLAASQADRSGAQQTILTKVGLGGFAGAGAYGGALVGIGIAAGAAKETYDLVKASAELADEISDMSAEYQVSTDEIQTWRAMARGAGIDAKAYGESLINVQKNLTNNAEKFKDWGMDVEALRRLKPEELLGAMSDKLQSLNANDRLTFIEDFKLAGAIVPDLLDGFDKLREAAAGSINPLTPEEIDNLKETKDAITEMGGAWSDMWTEIGNSLGSDEQIRDFFKEIAGGLKDLVKFISENRGELALVAKLFGSGLTMNPVAAAKAVGQYAGVGAGPGFMESMNRTFGMGRGYAGDDYGVAGTESGPGGKTVKVDSKALEVARKKAAEDARAHAEKLRAAYQAEIEAWEAFRLLVKSGNGAAMNEWAASQNARAGLSSPAERARREAEIAERRREAEAAWQLDLALPGASAKKRSKGWNGLEIEDVKIIDREIYKAAQHSRDWAGFLQNAANQLSAMGRAGSAVGGIIGGIGGIGALFQKKDGKNAFSGGLSFGSAAAGLQAGFAALDIGKTLYSLLHKTEAQKVAFDVGRDYGVQISEGLAKEIAKTSKTIGREGSSLLNLDKIIGEAGGVNAFGVDKTVAKMRDLFSMIQTGKLTVEQAKKPFDALFGETMQASIDKTTGLISEQARELIALGIDAGMNGDGSAIRKWQSEQYAKAQTFAERLAKNPTFKVAGEAAGNLLGLSLQGAYQKMLDEGLSRTEIAEKLGPQLDVLRKKFEDAGVSGGAAFAHVSEQLALFGDELTGPYAEALADTVGLMTALFNAGDLSRADFAGGAAQFGAQFAALRDRMVAGGKESETAQDELVRSFADELQKIWEMQRRLGVELDPETQQALDDAAAAGLIGPEFMDPMLAGQERTNELLEIIARASGATVPDAPGLRIPRDLASYTGGGVDASTARAVREMAITQDPDALGASVADNLNPAIASLEATAAAVGAAASAPVTATGNVVLQDGTICGAMTALVERGSGPGTNLVTAIANDMKRRGLIK